MQRRAFWLGVLGLLGVGAVVRAIHLDWGLPEIYEEAIPVREAIEFWGAPGRQFDFNPQFFKYPSLTFYLNFFLQAVWYFWLSLSGSVGSLNEFRQILADDLPRAVFLGRCLQVVLGTLLILPVVQFAKLLAGNWGGLCAGALVAVLPMAVVESQVVSPDMALTLFAALALVSATQVAVRNRRNDYLWCGVWIGLAAASKYPGALLVPALFAGHALRERKPNSGPADLLLSGLVWQGLGTALVVFFVASPFVFLNPGLALEDISFEQRHMAFGHFGREEGRALGFYLGQAIPKGWTPVVAVAAVAGLASLLINATTRRRAIPGCVYGLILLAVLGFWKMAASRYVLPLVPVAVAGAGALVAKIAGLNLRLSRGGGILAVLITGLLLMGPLRVTMDEVAFRGRKDSRQVADSWISENVPEGSALLVERYGPEPAPDRYLTLYLPFHGVTPHIYDGAYLSEFYATFDYVVLSTGVSARYLARPREYPWQVAFYAHIDRDFREVARFSPGVYTGPEIRILKNRAPVKVNDLSRIPPSLFNSQKGNSRFAEYLSTLGTVLVRQGNIDAGFELLQEAVNMDPENVQAWGNLGAMSLAQGRDENALQALRKARELDPENGRVWFNLGRVFSQMGESRQAADAYQKALAFLPELEDAYLGLARSLVEDDRFAQARAVLQEFLRRFPRSDKTGAAKGALEELRLMGPGRR